MNTSSPRKRLPVRTDIQNLAYQNDYRFKRHLHEHPQKRKPNWFLIGCLLGSLACWGVGAYLAVKIIWG